jgi:acyl-coenzyme A thioesterase PaaI-like protein
VSVNSRLIEQSGDAYRRCFGCGTENPIGLRLVFREEEHSAVAEFQPRPEYQGWDRMLHGGIVLTMLDETLAYAALFAAGPAVTAEITARLRNPGPMDQSYRLRGTVTKIRLGMVQAHASIHTEAGTLVAEADGKFMLIR